MSFDFPNRRRVVSRFLLLRILTHLSLFPTRTYLYSLFGQQPSPLPPTPCLPSPSWTLANDPKPPPPTLPTSSANTPIKPLPPTPPPTLAPPRKSCPPLRLPTPQPKDPRTKPPATMRTISSAATRTTRSNEGCTRRELPIVGTEEVYSSRGKLTPSPWLFLLLLPVRKGEPPSELQLLLWVEWVSDPSLFVPQLPPSTLSQHHHLTEPPL